jgi:hypothetical protein
VLAGQLLERRQQAGPVGVGELQALDRLDGGARADGQHATPPALAHARDDAPQDRHRRDDERAVRGLPLLVGEAERVDPHRRAAGVGHVDVDRAEVARDGVDEAVDRGQVVAVEGMGLDLAGDGACGLSGRALVARGDRHAGALRRERLGDGAADAARATGHQRDLPVQAQVHGCGV